MGDDRVAGDFLQRQFFRAQDGMAFFRNHAARDREAGQHRQAREGPHRFGADGDIRLLRLHLLYKPKYLLLKKQLEEIRFSMILSKIFLLVLGIFLLKEINILKIQLKMRKD